MAGLLPPGVALGFLWAASPAPAQSIGDWNGSYRTAPAKPAAGKQALTPSPTPRIDVTPVIAITSQPGHKPRLPRRAVSQAVRVHHHPRPAASAPVPSPTPPVSTASPTPTPTPAPVKLTTFPPPHRPAKPSPPTPAPKGQDLPQWPLGLTAVLGGAAGWALWRRKSRALIDEAPKDTALPVPQPAPPAVIAAPDPVESTPPPAPGPELTLDFVPTRFTTTLTEAILRYRLTVINRGAALFGPLVIAGVMEATWPGHPASAAPAPLLPAASGDRPFRPTPGFSPHPHFTPYGEEPAHADLSDEPQPLFPARPEIASSPAAAPAPLAECHRLMLLRPGEGADFAGQMRLSLADITPIRVGSAALCLPVVRLSMEAGRIANGEPSGPPLLMELCLMVGQAAPQAGGEMVSLAPLRLDGEAAVEGNLTTRAVAG